MSVTHDDLDSFNQFARTQIATGTVESLGELFDLYRIEHPTSEELEDTHAAIKQGFADVEAGRGQPAAQVFAELRAKHGLTDDLLAKSRR